MMREAGKEQGVGRDIYIYMIMSFSYSYHYIIYHPVIVIIVCWFFLRIYYLILYKSHIPFFMDKYNEVVHDLVWLPYSIMNTTEDRTPAGFSAASISGMSFATHK